MGSGADLTAHGVAPPVPVGRVSLALERGGWFLELCIWKWANGTEDMRKSCDETAVSKIARGISLDFLGLPQAWTGQASLSIFDG